MRERKSRRVEGTTPALSRRAGASAPLATTLPQPVAMPLDYWFVAAETWRTRTVPVGSVVSLWGT